ncbi:MAG: hypothetical protein COA69_04370 [Robiginitomaculum sp.]|nr:MAG: hypothetical protein COA69_04370 [Robiginitomaculum sp.]
MGTFGKWATGLIILGVVALVLEVFTPWGAKAHSVAMGNSVEATLKDAGFGSLNISMEGNVAKLSGNLPSTDAKTAALTAAQNAQCEDCAGRRAGGARWHEVDGTGINVVKPMLTVQPYTLTGIRTKNAILILNGYVSDEAERQELLAVAETLFPGNVTDQTVKIAQGAPNSAWLSVASANIGGLSLLETGRFTMKDSSSVLVGQTSTVEARNNINEAIAALGGSTNISVPNMQAANIGQINDEDVCQRNFERLKGDNKIEFSTGSAEIAQAPSLALLANLAAAAKQCSSFNVVINGHTDIEGDSENNLVLSQNRAFAVANVLIAQGVDAAQLSAFGHGDTNPIASNDTDEGKAQNRRIEFTVTQSK